MSTANGNQAAFLARVRAALGRGPLSADVAAGVLPREMSPEAQEKLARVRARSRAERLALADRMREAAAQVRHQVRCVQTPAEAAAAIADIAAVAAPEWAERKGLCAWDHELLRTLDLAGLCAAQGMDYYQADADPAALRQAAAQACVGVTAADACVAETGTVVLFSGPGRPRLVSLLPSIHVAVARLDAVVADFPELYALLAERQHAGGLPGSFVYVSGPSKTGDIEAVMVHGVHGPCETHLILIAGE
jgi:L-lactate dehydrogenase complex protein LldG